MLVRIAEDRMGNVVASPVNEKTRRDIAADMERNGAPHRPDNGTLFLQQPTLDEVRNTLGPSAVYRGEVNDGARIRVDDWAFRHYCGWSAD